MKKFIWITLAFAFTHTLFAQKLSKKDSLRNYIATVKEDTIKALEYIDLGNMMEEQDSMLYYYNLALELSRASNFSKGISRSLSSKVNWIIRNESIEAAKEAYKSSIEELEKRNYLPGLANHNIRLGYTFLQMEQFDSLYYYIEKGIKYAEEADDKSTMVLGNLAIGNTLFFQQKPEEALERYFNVVNISMSYELGKTSLKLATAYESMGTIFNNKGNLEKALEYFQKAYDIYQLKSYPYGINSTKVRIGRVFVMQENCQEALPLFSEAIIYLKPLARSDGKLNQALEGRGECYYKAGNLELAEKDFRSYYERAIKDQDPYYVRRGYYLLGRANAIAGNRQQALLNFEKAIDLSTGMKEYEFLLDILQRKLTIEKQLGISTQAIATYDKILETKDSLDAVSLRTNLETLEAQFNNQLQEKEIELLASKNEQTIIQKQNQTRLFLFITSLLLVIAIALYLGYRNKHKVHKELQKLNALKTDLYTNIAHEIRTPLTLIKAPVEHQLQQKHSPSTKKDLELVASNANKMLGLVDQLSNLSKLDAGLKTLQVSYGSLDAHIKQIVAAFQRKAQSHNRTITTHFNHPKEAYFDPEVITHVLQNLLENAIKYSASGSTIDCNTSYDDAQFSIRVENQLESNHHPITQEIFERYHQGDQTTEGMGIGLSLVSKYVELNHGTLHYEVKDATVGFTVSLPYKESHFQTSEIHNTISKDKQITSVPPLIESEEKPLLLLVEDDQGIREFTASLFEKNYNVHTAKEGREGLKLALELVPDIIISDVMMPEMDGIQLTKNLKENAISSHIPVMLLTAKTDTEDMLQGLEVLADDYVAKPFNPQLLAQKVENLIENRNRLRERFGKNLYLKPIQVETSSSEEKFIKMLTKVLDQHLTDPSFNANTFAKELGYNRMQLHRKLKALTDMSASEFLRTERIKASVPLLEKGDLTVAEVAYAVGFNTVSYFNKCFKDHFQKPPQSFVNKGK